MRVTFVDLNYHLSSDGTRLLTSILREHGHSVRNLFTSHIDHWNVQFTDEEFKEQFGDTEIYLFSFLSPNIHRAIWLTAMIKRVQPDVKVVWGGVHASATPDDCLLYADYVCMREADKALPEFLARFEAGDDVTTVWNFCCKKEDGSIIKNALWPQTDDLTTLPPPSYELDQETIVHEGRLEPMTLELMEKYYSPYMFGKPAYTVFASFGCPFVCTFCYNSELAKDYGRPRVRFRNLVQVVKDEIIPNMKRFPFFEAVGFMDDDFFLFKTSELREFCEIWKKEVGLPFGALATPSTVKTEKLELLVDAGLKYLQIGIQSGSERLSKDVYERKTSNARLMQALERMEPFCTDGRLGVYGDFIIDNPYETSEDVFESIKLYRMLPKWIQLNLFSLTFYPGSSLYSRALEDGLITGDYDVYTKDFSNLQHTGHRFMTYLFMFHFFLRSKLPDWIFRFLLSSPVLFIGNHLPKWIIDGIWGKRIWPRIHKGLLY